MKQSIGLKAAVAAITERYGVKEGLARRLARAEVKVLQQVYPQLKNASEDTLLATRYASSADAVNVIRDIHIPAIVHLVEDPMVITEYQTIVREVVVNAQDEDGALEDFQEAVDVPNAADIARVIASYDRRENNGKGGLFRVPEFREAFAKFQKGEITEAELADIASHDEMVRYRIDTGDYGEETEEMEFEEGEPTAERFLKMRPDAKMKGYNV
jgi:hypothetical protein